MSNEAQTRLVVVLVVCGAACGGPGSPQTGMSLTCGPNRTPLDGVCVREEVADYVACVRAQGAQVGAGSSQSLSAEAGAFGVKAGAAYEVSDQLQKKYAASDQVMLSIIEACNKTGLTFQPGAAAATESRAPDPRTCAEQLTRTPQAVSGVFTLDPDGGGVIGAMPFYCDMTQDGGGWTLVGRGLWYQGYSDNLPPGTNAVLTDGTRAAVLAAAGRLWRLGSADKRLFIRDSSPIFGDGPVGRHFWRTNSASVECATSYAQVADKTMRATGAHGMNCDGQGIGAHTCGSRNGWILWHVGGTYDFSGQHPCSTGTGEEQSTTLDLWVR